MIISVHVPKTAGSSLRTGLRRTFGERMLDDNGDWSEMLTPEGERHNRARRQAMLERRDEIEADYDAIHGHFTARKYAGVFKDSRFVIFLRDPYQHAVSTYEHARRTHTDRPDHLQFSESQMSLLDMLAWIPDHQSLYLGDYGLDDFAVVGMTEQYARSVQVLRAVCGLPAMSDSDVVNVNPTRHAAIYPISEEIRRAVETHRARDLDLYRQARERLEALARRCGV